MARKGQPQVAASVHPKMVEFLDEQAERLGLSRSGALRYAITIWMERETQRPRIEKALEKGIAETLRLHREGLLDLEEFTDDASESTGA